MAGLYNGVFVMADRQTGSVWTHYDGTVLTGPLAGTGTRLEVLPLHHRRWKDWLAEHPDSGVLAWEERYADHYWETEPGTPGLGRMFLDTIVSLDDRLPENELVLGVDSGSGSRAYRLAGAQGLTVLDDEIGGVPVVVVLDPDSMFGMAFSTDVDGRQRTFEAGDGVIVDDSGASWSLEGVGDHGRLTFVTGFVTEWYGWAAYHPDTDIWPD